MRLLKRITCAVSALLFAACLTMFPAGHMTAFAGPVAEGPGAESAPILGGAELKLLAGKEGSSMMTAVIRTVSGDVIVVDGGRAWDKDHLLEVLGEYGNHVSLWLVTHPHDDHVGALTEILNMQPCPVQIDRIAYSFLPNEMYAMGEHQNRMSDLTNFQAALTNAVPTSLMTPLYAGQQFAAGDAVVTVLNEPFYCDRATFNNSSVAYRIDVGGKRMLFLGDMGVEAGNNLIAQAGTEALKADILQLSHHGNGNDNAGWAVYSAASPEICLWPTAPFIWNSSDLGAQALCWMLDGLGVKRHLVTAFGDQVLR